jgi:hypothetical protein
MGKIYFKTLLGLVVLLWGIYLIQGFTKYEGFTPKIHSLYRPYIRQMNQRYEGVVINYGPSVIINKLRKWNIY